MQKNPEAVARSAIESAQIGYGKAKTVSEMMREKRMKKNIRKFTGGKQHHFPSDN